jgi:hypothetical protein
MASRAVTPAIFVAGCRAAARPHFLVGAVTAWERKVLYTIKLVRYHKQMKLQTVASYALLIAADAFLMRAELHTDDDGILAGLVLLTALLLGSLHPRRAWQWALLVGPCIPLSDLIFGHGMKLRDMMLLTAFLAALGLIGAYLGVLIRKALTCGFTRDSV